MTQSLRQQQDEAYELSLRADQEKERVKQLERDEILRQQRAFEDELHAEQQRKEVSYLFVVLGSHCKHTLNERFQTFSPLSSSFLLITQDIARLKIELASQVPSEPEMNHPQTVGVLFKLPNGQRIERRFKDSDLLKVCTTILNIDLPAYQIFQFLHFFAFHFDQDVYNYIFCHPASPDSFQLTTNFPKRVLEAKDSSHTLAEAGVRNRDVLFVNDLDA